MEKNINLKKFGFTVEQQKDLLKGQQVNIFSNGSVTKYRLNEEKNKLLIQEKMFNSKRMFIYPL